MLSLDQSPYVVGVTGHMDLRPEKISLLKYRIEILLRFITSGAGKKTEQLGELIELLEHGDVDKRNSYSAEAYLRGLGNWPSFNKTPLVVLTSLAPGADSIFAEVALDLKSKGHNIHVIAPLPFHHDQYKDATTFTDDDQQTQKQRKEKYQELLLKVGVENTFCVRTKNDVDLEVEDSGNSAHRYAAGEYIAKHSHLMVAIWDHEHDANALSGTAAIVRARRSHSRFDTNSDVGLNLPHGGPLFHLYTHRQDNVGPANEFLKARFLYCYSTEPQAKGTLSADQREQREALWHFGDLALMRRIAMNLENFNRETVQAKLRLQKRSTL